MAPPGGNVADVGCINGVPEVGPETPVDPTSSSNFTTNAARVGTLSQNEHSIVGRQGDAGCGQRRPPQQRQQL
jgi:hypothetical protein